MTDSDSNSSNAKSDVDPADSGSAEVAALKKDYLYLRADFDNYKKSAIKERSELLRYGAEPLIVQLLLLLDTFDQALSLEITSENVKSFQAGIKMIRHEFNNVLTRFGVTSVGSTGAAFDPNLHEALGSEPSNTIPAGHISQELKPAYKLHDRVIRPAQVIIAKESAEPPPLKE